MPGRRTACPVETQTRKLPVTALKRYPVIRADFRKLPGGSVCSQVEAEFISWYTCSSERKTLVWKQIMHAWLIELHTLPWTHKDKKKGFVSSTCSFKADLIHICPIKLIYNLDIYISFFPSHSFLSLQCWGGCGELIKQTHLLLVC